MIVVKQKSLIAASSAQRANGSPHAPIGPIDELDEEQNIPCCNSLKGQIAEGSP